MVQKRAVCIISGLENVVSIRADIISKKYYDALYLQDYEKR